MEKRNICNNKFSYNLKNKVVGLPVAFKGFPGEIKVEKNDLMLRESFHVSLVCVGKIIEKYNISISDFENKIIDDFCDFTKLNKIEIKRFGDFRFVVQDDLRSVVVMCEISNLNNFFDSVNRKYGLAIEYPPTHVTLYTLESKPGIFLTDSSDIKNLTKTIENPTGVFM